MTDQEIWKQQNSGGTNFQNQITGDNAVVNQAQTINQEITNNYSEAPQERVGRANNLPRSGAQVFLGRDEALVELHGLVQAPEMASICGMGGVGKTELALQYAERYQDCYEGGVCWLQARQELGLQIVRYAQGQLGVKLPVDQNLDLEAQVAHCWRCWPEGDVLLIFDDVQAYESIEAFLPPGLDARFKVLLTTRLEIGGKLLELPLDVLVREQSLGLLRAVVGETRINAEAELADWLCAWLGDLPLGLELVGRYLAKKKRVSLATLQERLEENRLDAGALGKAYPGMTAQAGVAAAFEVSWETLSEQAKLLAALLSLFALAPIPWEIIEACLPDSAEEELEDCRDEELVGLHLLQPVEGAEEYDAYQLHQLVWEFFTAKLQAMDLVEQLTQQFCHVWADVASEMPHPLIQQDIKLYEIIIPHVGQVAEFHYDFLSDDDLVWPFLGLIRFYESQGLYNEAEPWGVQCHKVAETRFGESHPDVAASLNTLANLYKDQGRYSEAEPLFLQDLEMSRALLGESHPDVATSLNNLANFYKDQGRYSEAEPLFLQDLEMSRALLGESHPDVATSLNNLANLYKDQGRYSEAEPLFLQDLEMSRALLGESHPDVAASLNTLANLYKDQGRYSEAEPLFLQALEMRRALLGESHPHVAASLNNLANLYKDQGRYSEAEPLFLYCLEIAFEVLGDEHEYTQAYFENFVDCLQSAITDNQIQQLSNNPWTQELLAQLQQEAD